MAIALNAVRVPFVLSPQWSTPLINPPASTKTYFKVFLNGQPKALGTLQISAAFIQISLGAILYFVSFFSYTNFTINSGIPFWGPVLYIISGSLSVAAGNRESSCLIGFCLAMNIISSLTSTLELALLIPDISDFTSDCNNSALTPCVDHVAETWIIRIIILISLIIVSLLEFCVAVSLSSFGCHALSYKSIESLPQQALLFNNECWTRHVQPVYPHTLMPNPVPASAPPMYPAIHGSPTTTSNSIPNPIIPPQLIFP
ncbi:membrane-spanning 4-domains subfamily A member 4D-like [Rana temporaria]|uniref:membrane-spanning 4-domains subfamily A member 4D-like n=1 Tax=Rana temporaria TaxID=8407 RepID=UPI001AADAB38|nr:membrane-spanning 4-domains subfamily A member 4D-like [Rana temporaria]